MATRCNTVMTSNRHTRRSKGYHHTIMTVNCSSGELELRNPGVHKISLEMKKCCLYRSTRLGDHCEPLPGLAQVTTLLRCSR